MAAENLSKSITVSQAIEAFISYIACVRGMSKKTVEAYSFDLSRFALMACIGKDTPIQDITLEDLRSCIATLSMKNSAPATINRFVSSVRSLFAYCRNFHYIKINPAFELKSVKQPKHLPRFMTSDEVDKLCAQPVKYELLWQTRDHALFELLYSTGCRLSEVVLLREKDFDSDYSSAIVTGKGSKERRVYLEKDARLAVKLYIQDKRKRFPDSKEEHLFVNWRGKALSNRGIAWIIKRYSGAEGTKHHVNPHAFRHTFATAMLSAGADIRLVQELLGHSSISTTQRYTHINTDRLIEMYNKAHPHGGSKK